MATVKIGVKYTHCRTLLRHVSSRSFFSRRNEESPLALAKGACPNNSRPASSLSCACCCVRGHCNTWKVILESEIYDIHDFSK